MLQGTYRRGVTASYGLFALVLLATLAIGLMSGGLFGGYIARRAAAAPGSNCAPPLTAARAWLGVTYIPLTQAVARQYNLTVSAGALVVGVTANSPAERSGIVEGDAITAVDQVAIADSSGAEVASRDPIMDAIRAKKPGDTLQMTILRNQEKKTVDIVLGQLPQWGRQPGEGSRLQRLYDNLLQRFGVQ